MEAVLFSNDASLGFTEEPTPYSDIARGYCRDVVSGNILNSKWIRYACQQHLDNLSTISRWFYDAERTEQCCGFIEALTLSNGQPFILSAWQVWIVASLVGWVDADGIRKHIEALLLVPKGNGKSPLAAALGLWFAFFDKPTISEVYCGATTLSQAQEVFNPARAFVDAQSAFAELNVTALKRSIFNDSGSRFQSVIGKGKHGARPYLFVLDELHQAKSDDLYGTAKTGCNKVHNSLLLTTSTAGVAAMQNPCFILQDRAQKALDGSLPDERLFAALYCADDSVEWSSAEALRMANPNLGISNDAEKIAIAIQEALRRPAEQANVRAMHLNQWSTVSSPWLNMVDWQACYDPDFTPESVSHLPNWKGADFAIKLDLTCVCTVWRDGSKGDKPHFYVSCRTYLPETQVHLPENGHYRRWSPQWLTATEGNTTDLALVEQDTIADCTAHATRELGFDTTFADRSMQIIAEACSTTVIPMAQRAETFSPPMRELDVLIADKRIHHDGNPVLTWCLSNVTTRKRPLGDYTTPGKQVPENKIDAAISFLLALNRARLAQPVKRGLRFSDFGAVQPIVRQP